MISDKMINKLNSLLFISTALIEFIREFVEEEYYYNKEKREYLVYDNNNNNNDLEMEDKLKS